MAGVKPRRVTTEQRNAVRELLAEGLSREAIAARTGLTPGQVSAVAAHVTMGTYGDPPSSRRESQDFGLIARSPVVAAKTSLPTMTSERSEPVSLSAPVVHAPPSAAVVAPVYLGIDDGTCEPVFWNPDPDSGAANPHTLVVGESGFGKTYAISSLLAELGRQGVPSLVFDYGQGFTGNAAPPEFIESARPMELPVNRNGVDVNPFRIFPSDHLGPVNVAQRLADTFARVYTKIGVQQHAVLRQAVMEVLGDHGIWPEAAESWNSAPPDFSDLQRKLADYADRGVGGTRNVAAALASHVSTMFVYNTFRDGGQRLAWDELVAGGVDGARDRHRVLVLQLRGLEHTLERAVTELLLWNFIGFVEALGPSRLRCFVVLDEAHRLSFDPGSPVEKLLREGRKFGIGLILASQQPEDFSPVAFANTATKLVFQVGDNRYAVSRQLQRKLRNHAALGNVSNLITTLPRGVALFVSENIGRVVRIANFRERVARWKQ